MKLWTSDDLWLPASRKGDPVFAMENGEYIQMTAEKEFVVDTKTRISRNRGVRVSDDPARYPSALGRNSPPVLAETDRGRFEA